MHRETTGQVIVPRAPVIVPPRPRCACAYHPMMTLHRPLHREVAKGFGLLVGASGLRVSGHEAILPGYGLSELE